MMEKYCSDAERIRENVLQIRSGLREAALAARRDPSEVRLVAATKTQSAERVRAAIAAGVDAVGENRAQELAEKWEQGAYEGVPLHFIGHLQRNKVKLLVGRCALIHSVGSAAVALEIERQADKLGLTQAVLLEVNIGRENEKSGFLPETLYDELPQLLALQCVDVQGFMVIPPAGVTQPNYFAQTKQLLIDICGKFGHTKSIYTLSMGMSDDYQRAVMAGAHFIRIGAAIFGART